jgi:hypothetical protein
LFHGQLVGRGFDVRIVTAVCDMDVANMSCSGSCNDGRLCVRTGVAKHGVRWNSYEMKHGVWWEVFHRELVARGFELRSATALSDKRVGNISCCSNNNVDRLRV